MMKTTVRTLLLISLFSMNQESLCQESTLYRVMEPFIGNWKEKQEENDSIINYRKFKWGLEKKIVRFYEAPGQSRKWRVESVITWNPVENGIQANDWTDWGNYVSVRIEVKKNGIDRIMKVYNATDGKMHDWISEWRWVDQNTWKSQAREVDGDGNTITVWPESVYIRVNNIPKTVVN